MADKMKVMGKGYASPISFEVDLEPLKNIFVDVLEQQKDTDDKMMRGIKEYMSDAVESETVFIEGHKTPHYLYRLYEYIKDSFNLDETMDYSWRRETEVPPSKYNFEVKRGEKMVLIYKGLLFISSKENPDEKYVIWMTPYDEDLGLEMEIFYDGEREQFKARKDSFLESFNENHPLKNEIVDSKWKYLDVKNVGWSEIIVSDEQRKIINRNIINFIKNLSMYKENRLPTSRGVLITGPPGTGKTLCCEVIVNDLDCSTIYVSTDSVSEVGDIKKVYSLARKISPCLVIVEDIDTLGGLDRTVRGGEHPLLGEFLNCLAGMGDNDGVITIATTNYAEHLDAALADRPGRFDVRLNFGLPNAELRKHILDKYLKDLGVKVKLNGIVDKTEGLSGAYLKEIVMTAYMISTEKDEKVNKDTLNEAIDEILLLKGKVNPNFNQKKSSTNNLYG
jgi:AAA+ superfamily predicted ATPase